MSAYFEMDRETNELLITCRGPPELWVLSVAEADKIDQIHLQIPSVAKKELLRMVPKVRRGCGAWWRCRYACDSEGLTMPLE